MHLQGSCHCGAVSFELDSSEPVPYQRCYCSICRKTSGGGGFAINLGGNADTLRVRGEEHVRIYQAMLERDGTRVQSSHQRHFCSRCGSHLWAWNEDWPALVHPVAGAIDTELPKPPAHVHMMVDSRASWAELEGKPDDPRFDEYPEQSLTDWHAKHAPQ